MLLFYDCDQFRFHLNAEVVQISTVNMRKEFNMVHQSAQLK